MERVEIISLIGSLIQDVLKKDCLIVFYGSILDERFGRISDHLKAQNLIKWINADKYG